MGSEMCIRDSEENGYSDFNTSLTNVGGNAAATRGDINFRNKWKELAKSDATAKRFKQAQHDFIQRTHHDPAVRAIAKDTGIDVCDGSHSNGLQDTVWSTAVQFGPGGARKIFKEAHTSLLQKNARKDPPVTVITDADLINEIHDIKINTVPTRFRSSPALHGGLISRFKSERGVALANASTGSTTASSTIV